MTSLTGGIPTVRTFVRARAATIGSDQTATANFPLGMLCFFDSWLSVL